MEAVMDLMTIDGGGHESYADGSEEEDDSYFYRKRLCIKTSIGDNIFESFKIIVKGKTYWIRAKVVTGWAPKFSDNQDVSSDSDVGSEDVNDDALSENGKEDSHSEADIIPETIFEECEVKSSDIKEKPNEVQQEAQSEDPFKIYDLLKTNHPISNVAHQYEDEPMYPPGFTPCDNSANINKVPTGGYSFTWSHKSAAKMSKLDRFLVSEYLMSNCLNLSAVILDRYLSDHRPILLRETYVDYGPYPFRFFNYWFELEGFDSFVADTWRINNILESNAMLKLIKKLKLFKGYKGEATSAMLDERLNIMNDLISLENNVSLELAQKAKIKWAIEGDENSKFFHGISTNIGITSLFVVLLLMESGLRSLMLLKMNFFLTLGIDSIVHERPFSMEEVKGVVWGCGLNKSPGLDGFTFEFYRRGSILVNGCPTLEFQFYKGLKQGDPLSPFLFILFMESLNLSLHNVVSVGLFKGVNLDNSLQLSHLFYADDVVFVGQWRDSNLFTIIRSMVEAAASNIGCMALNISFSYRGIIIASKEKGGLGVSSFYALNRALTFKWIWRFRTQGSSLWSRVIKLIHGEDGKIDRSFKHGLMSNWNNIPRGITLLQNKGIDLLGYIKKKTRNGENTLFWGEVWKSDVPFSLLYPRIFALESCKFITVANKMAHSSLASSLRRNPRGGIEQVQMANLISNLEGGVGLFQVLVDESKCDVPISENSPICDDHSEIFSDSKNDDDISVYEDDFEDIEYVEASLSDPEIVSVEEENEVNQEEEEIDLEDISQIQDVVLHEKLLSITRLISNIESLNDNPTPIEPDQERLINLVKNDIFDNSSNDPLLEKADLFLASDNLIPSGIENVANDSEGDVRFLEELLIDDSILSHKSSDFNFEDNPPIPRPPSEPPDAKTNAGEEIPVVMNDKDKFDKDYYFFMFDKVFSFIFAESEDTIFDPGISI
nr:RNA-directed DNA polymerase, eukaryota, reverse transcriptase zinc-binding domain protein [Tanacetum cinerariifolium]